MKNKTKFKKIFLSKQLFISRILLALRIFIVIGCVSLVGARIFLTMQQDRAMEKLLFDAVQGGDTERVRELLESGCNPDALDEERNTPLYFTSFNVLYGDQYLEIMKLLLAFYASVDQQNYRGETTLHGCVRIENFEKLKIAFSTLLSYGATISLEDRDGNTMLNELVRLNTMGAVDMLLGSYADIFGIDAVEKAIQRALFYTYTDLIKNVLNKYLKQLREKTFLPPKSRNLGTQLAVILMRDQGSFGRIEPGSQEVDQFGNNQLHLAVMIGNIALVEKLLEKSKKLASIKNKNGSYPIHFVSRAGNSIETRKKMLELFYKYDVSINLQDGSGATLLHIMIRKKDYSLLKYALEIFEKKVDRNVKDNNRETIRDLLGRLDRSKLAIL